MNRCQLRVWPRRAGSLLIAIFVLFWGSVYADQYKIGVLAHRGVQATLDAWTPTAEYLSGELSPHTFTIVPVNNPMLDKAVSVGQVDFVLTNPGSYVRLESRYHISRMVTLRNLRQGKPYTHFGAVIFTRADNADILDLKDLSGRSFMGVRKTAFGGFQMAWRELKAAGVDPFVDFSRLEFAGLPQDTIVYAVRDRLVDAGTVRTDTLERMAKEGKINLEDFRVINRQFVEGFPFLLSTRLYPEWAFAKNRHTSETFAQQVAVALLQMPLMSPAAQASRSAGWTVPLDYQPVHEIYSDLHIGPYQHLSEITLEKLIERYWLWLSGITIVVLGVLFLITVYIWRLNRNLKVSEGKLLTLTGELSKTNVELQQLSTSDSLTGLANYRAFDNALRSEWLRAQRLGTPLSLLMIDIDSFKPLNDRYGHQAGDECLRQVADALTKEAKRASDLVARYGGEEFGVIMPTVGNSDATAVAERMRARVESLQISNEGSSVSEHLTVSIGIATVVPSRKTSTEDLIAAADGALYQAKSNGRNQIKVAKGNLVSHPQRYKKYRTLG